MLLRRVPLAPRLLAAQPACRARSRYLTGASITAPAGPTLEGVTVVSTPEDVRRVLSIIEKLPDTTFHAWDTEVADIDVKTQSPVGHGRVICASFFSGPNIDYGSGPRVWVDNLDAADGLLLAFKPVLESSRVRKVWHNYSFDRHVLFNHGIDCKGFAGDTMHMARLWNTSLKTRGGYSLEGLSEMLLARKKTSMKDLFAVPGTRMDGTPSKVKTLPPLESIQRNPEVRSAWIDYSAYDAEATWLLREELDRRLRERRWVNDHLSMYAFYERYLLPFGELLTDLERAGIHVDAQKQLPAAERRALAEREHAEKTFLSWASRLCPDAVLMNVGSDVQKAHFLFAPCARLRPGSKAAKKEAEASAASSAKAKSRQPAPKKAPAAAAAVTETPLEQHRQPPPSIDVSTFGALSSAPGPDGPPIEPPPPAPKRARARKSPVSTAPAASSGAADTSAAEGAAPVAAPVPRAKRGSKAKAADESAASAISATDPAAGSALPGADVAAGPSASSATGPAPSLHGQGHPLHGTPIGAGAGAAAPGSVGLSSGGVMQRLSSPPQQHVGSGGAGVHRSFFSFGSSQLARMAAMNQQGTQQGLDPRLQAQGASGPHVPSQAQHTPGYAPLDDSSEDSDSFRSALGDSDSGSDGEAVYMRYEDYSGDEGDAGGPPTYQTTVAQRRRGGGGGAGSEPPASEPGGLSRDADVWPAARSFKIENTEGYIEPGAKKAKKSREIVLTGLGIPPVARTALGWPAASSEVLKMLAGKIPQHPVALPDDPAGPPPKPLPPPVYGTAYDYFGGGEEGAAACGAIHALWSISVIDTMLSNFIVPLQVMADAQSRVHCSLNLNTETGRLSARRPNLQNQPALEKDRFGVRKAFMAPPGRKLICADYGQLELRLLAHMAKCRSMLDAFSAGGDFHSRTAAGMYPYVQADIDAGRVLLEWDGPGEPPVPLLKNVYATERRKAKVLNFSIAYGKTAMGLSKDWGVSLSEAKETVERWYADRPEVREWQAQVLESARAETCTRTLLGRYRDLPEINSPDVWARRHSERAAINTPIQGGAADVAMMAMLKLWRNDELRRLGWRMLLQIHDEVILEGPEETSKEALALVEADMTQPFVQPLLVELSVDAKVVDNWYEAK